MGCFVQAPQLRRMRAAFVKAIGSEIRPKQSPEILTGRVETIGREGHAFAVVRNLDGQAKQRVQAILRRYGRGPETKVRILSDGEDGLRGVVGWFGKQCEHRLDWFMCPEELKTSAEASSIFLGEPIAMSGATIVRILTV